MNTIEIDSVNLSFDTRKILTNIYLKCKTGDVIGVVGRNGAGKSCLMKIIFGSLLGEYQSVRLNGTFRECLYKVPNAIQYLHQDGFLMDYLCFNDIVEIFGLTPNLDRIMEFGDIDKLSSTKIGKLSGGMKKLIEIIAVLYSDSKFTILDEPFSFLSPVLVEKIIPHIKFQSRLKGIILSDHQYETVFETCNKFLLLNSGTLTEISQKSDLEAFGYIPTN